MTEQLKVPTTTTVPPPKPTLEERLTKMSSRELCIMADRISKHPKSREEGIIADLLLITQFKVHNRGNDPYMLDSHSRTTPFFEIKSGGKRHAPTPEKSTKPPKKGEKH